MGGRSRDGLPFRPRRRQWLLVEIVRCSARDGALVPSSLRIVKGPSLLRRLRARGELVPIGVAKVCDESTIGTLARRGFDGLSAMCRSGIVPGLDMLSASRSDADCPAVGKGRRMHTVEEILEVIEGQAEIRIEDEVMSVLPNQSVIVPAGSRHGFTNSGAGTLKVRATLASPVFEASYDDSGELKRRYSPNAS